MISVIVSDDSAISRSSEYRILTFGPYIRLGKGHYEMILTYRSKLTKTEMAGCWDVASNKASTVIDSGSLMGTDGEVESVKVIFNLTNNERNVEFRTYSNTAGVVELKAIRVRRLSVD